MNAWLDALWQASWQGGWAIFFALVFSLLAPRSPAWIRCWIWRLAFLRLLFALFWSSPVEVAILPRQILAGSTTGSTFLPSNPAYSLQGTHLPALPLGDQRVSLREFASSRNPSRQASGDIFQDNLFNLLFLTWALGAFVTGARLIRMGLKPLPIDNGYDGADVQWARKQLRLVCERLGVIRVPELRIHTKCGSPALAGTLKPFILLPAPVLECCKPCELRLVLAHEVAHLKRRDLWWNSLLALAGVLFFFHPLVWLARKPWRLAQEMATDEHVLRTMDCSANEYGEALIRVCAGVSQPVLNCALVSVRIVESAQTMKRRLKFMKHYRIPAPWKQTLAIASLLLIALPLVAPWRLVAQDFKSDASVPKDGTNPGTLSEAAQARARIDAEIRVLENGLQRLKTQLESGPPPAIAISSTNSTTDSFFKNPWKAGKTSPQSANHPNRHPETIDLTQADPHFEKFVKTFLQGKEFRQHRSLHIALSPHGIFISFLERDEHPLFSKDASQFTEYGEWVLKTIAWEIARHPAAPLELEGYAPANFQSARADYGAWELAFDRAQSARRILAESGIQTSQIVKLAASNQPLLTMSLSDPPQSSRSLSVLIRNSRPFRGGQ